MPDRAALAAETGLLDAAERRRRVRHDALIEPDHAGFHGLRDPQGAAQIIGENVRDEPEFGVVGRRDRVGLRLERCQRSHRAEDLLRRTWRPPAAPRSARSADRSNPSPPGAEPPVSTVAP